MVGHTLQVRRVGVVIVFVSGWAEVAGAGTIAITEFLSNPGVTEPTEWIELYNYSMSAVDLSGWSIADEGVDDVTLPDIVLPY